MYYEIHRIDPITFERTLVARAESEGAAECIADALDDELRRESGGSGLGPRYPKLHQVYGPYQDIDYFGPRGGFWTDP